jgi:hypothetical protein
MPRGACESKQISRPVIQAFNNIPAPSFAEFGRPAEAPDRLAAAKHPKPSLSLVLAYVIADEIGFGGERK